jgi:hypothetical protein
MTAQSRRQPRAERTPRQPRQPRQPRAARTPGTPRRRLNLGAVLLGVLVALVALITLLSLAPPPALPPEYAQPLTQLGSILIRIVTIVGAIAVLLGVLNLLNVHFRKMFSRTRASGYSLFTLLAFFVVIIVHIADRLNMFNSATAANGAPVVSLTVMDTVQVTIESALGGLLFFVLVYSAVRFMRRRVNIWNILFIVSLLIVLIGYIPMANMGFVASIRDWLLRVPVSAGTRGLLIGVALGTVVVGIRLLLGQDRSFRE